jgi:tryptophanyl-tRNA synthetase
VAEKKIWNAFTGGRPTEREQKKRGGDPSICTIYYYFYDLFEESDEKMEELENECRSGKIICGECKAILAERVKKFLREHQRKREKARDVVDDFFFK